jgi:hypothetical protein
VGGNVAGYRIYQGGLSGAYTNVADTGVAISANLVNLVEGMTYYFAVTAYDSSGLESNFSNELAYLTPGASNQLQARLTSSGQMVLTTMGSAGANYNIQATTNLNDWTTIAMVTLGAAGSGDFTDTNAAMYSKRFYRTVEIQP